jgi:hypothetical protein
MGLGLGLPYESYTQNVKASPSLQITTTRYNRYPMYVFISQLILGVNKYTTISQKF